MTTSILNLHLAAYVPESPKGPYIELYLTDNHGHTTSKRFYKRDLPGFWVALYRTAEIYGKVQAAEASIQARNIEAARNAPVPRKPKRKPKVSAGPDISLDDLLKP